MTRPTYSLHSGNRVTQEELINEEEAIGADAGKHGTLLRLAIDDLVRKLYYKPLISFMHERTASSLRC
jgi:RNA polymerase sigma factor